MSRGVESLGSYFLDHHCVISSALWGGTTTNTSKLQKRGGPGPGPSRPNARFVTEVPFLNNRCTIKEYALSIQISKCSGGKSGH